MTAIEFDNVGKQYRLGLVSTRTLTHDMYSWWQSDIRHREDPYLKIGETNDRSVRGSSEYVWALKDIDFKVEQGDVVGIIGKNGAGKSTLLKLLSRVTGPTVGEIRAKGRIGALLEVGTGFHPEMTGRENIYLNGAILGMTKAEISRKLDEIVDFSGCERYIDTPVKRYSSGMMVRLGFAVAAHLDPEILVVDEVLAVGDAEFQKKAIGKMQDVSRGEGRTVLFVSHNMSSIKALCKNGILLDKGRIAFEGTAIETVNRYQSINSSNASIGGEIRDRKDRIGSGEIRVTDVVFRTPEGGMVGEVFTEDPVEIDCFFECEEGVDLSKMIVSCGFEDLYGNRANEWVSDELEHDFSQLKEKKFSIHIPSLNLRPNNYFFFFKIMLHNTDERNIRDAMHFAKPLNVLPVTEYVGGRKLKYGRGYEAIVPAQFQ